MSEQTELDCVSCETTFDPSPTGGFCPDCDTPHPEFGHSEVEDGADDGADESTADTESDATADEGSGDAESGSVDETTGEPTPGAEAASTTGEPGGEATNEDEEENVPESEDAASSNDDETPAPAADDVPTHCPECGARILDDDEATDTGTAEELTACPDCGRSVSDESFCPDCGTDLEAHRDTDHDEPDQTEETASEPDETPAKTDDDEDEPVPSDTITLVVNGESYEVEDGETFGRDEEAWLDDLVVASGGSEGVSYVSSEHVEFSFEDDGVYVTDVSRNGTMHNGTDLEGGRTRVEDGDYLTLAQRAEIKIEF